MASRRLGQFEIDIGRAKDLVGLGQSIGGMTQGIVDASDMYRAALVQGVAALDAFVHGVVLDRSVAMLIGQLGVSGSATRVGLHFNAVQDLLQAGSQAQLELGARTHIAERLAQETYQRPDAISQALAMVGVGQIWAAGFGPKAGSMKTALGLIVGRRNRIVHACDVDPLTPGTVTSLSDADALDSITTVDSIVVGINGCL